MQRLRTYIARWKPWKRTGLAVGLFLVVAGVMLLVLPSSPLDWFLTRRITRTWGEANPGYAIQISGLHYGLLANRLECDSLSVTKDDSTMWGGVSNVSLSGIARLRLLLGGAHAPDLFADAHLEAHDAHVTFVRDKYEFRCAHVRLSVPDSQVVLEQIEVHPALDDERFFAGSAYRSTRFHLLVPECWVTGLATLELMTGRGYRARTVHFREPSLDVLINKDKPPDLHAARPRMPNEILSSITVPLRIDSILVTDARVLYNERFKVGQAPATLTFDSIQVAAAGAGNASGPGDTTVLVAQGVFLHGGTMALRMVMPLSGTRLALRYGGTLGEMKLNALNPFIEVSDQMRFKTGVLRTASFDVDVRGDSATGQVRVAYKDLKIVAIEGSTGSESGVLNTFVSFFANNVKLRTTNLPDKTGAMKIGMVKYARKNDEAILEFAWLAARSGLCDIIGM